MSMKRSHVMDVLKKGLHREARIASLALLTVIVLQALVVSRVVGDGELSLVTDKASYPIGGTVTFSGSVYASSDDKYGIDITYADQLVGSLEFTPTAEGAIPTGVSWVVPFDAEDGTYNAKVYVASDLSKTELVLSTPCTFQVLTKAESLEVLEGNLKDLASSVEATEISDSLLASLNNAIKKIESATALFEEDSGSKTAVNQLRAARNMLTAFVHKVLAQTGKGIEDEELAADLTGKALEYIRYIDSLIGSALVPLGKKLALNIEKTLAKQEMHMAQFMMRKGLDDATTDEELLSLLNSMEEELTKALGRVKGKMQLLQGLLENGVITEDDYQALLMELEKSGDSINLVKALSELLSEKLEELNQNRPGLGEHLGQLIKAIKQLVDDSTAAGKSHGELMSEAHSHANQHGGNGNGNGNGNNGNGNGNGNNDNGNGNGNNDNGNNGNGNNGNGNGNGNGNNGNGNGNNDNGNGNGNNDNGNGNGNNDNGNNGNGKGKNK